MSLSEHMFGIDKQALAREREKFFIHIILPQQTGKAVKAVV